MDIVYSIVIGYVMDLVLGDPYFLPHPIRWIGKLISILEKIVRKRVSKNNHQLIAGFIIAVIVMMLSGILVFVILYICRSYNRYLYIAVQGIICYYMLATRSLSSESLKVYKAIKYDSIEQARVNLSMIVGRDTAALDDKGIINATIETIAENTSDGVVAPLFYMLAFGGVGMVIYKAVNTLDSMIGYRDERYLYIGRFSARLDDVLNFIPSRLSAVLMIVSSLILGYDFKNAIKIFKRDRFKHKSPNSAQTEAVCAGALNIRLAGDAYYFGVLNKKPFIGDANKEAELNDILRANKLLYATSVLALVVGVAVRWLIVC